MDFQIFKSKEGGLNLTAKADIPEEKQPLPWKLFYSETDKYDNKKLTITVEGPDKKGVEDLLKTVKKEMVK